MEECFLNAGKSDDRQVQNQPNVDALMSDVGIKLATTIEVGIRQTGWRVVSGVLWRGWMVANDHVKVLILSRSAWRDDNNTGNTFTNLFSGWDVDSIAQIYCSPQKPSNDVCRRYYQINDRMLAASIIKREPAGKAFNCDEGDLPECVGKHQYESNGDKRLYDFVRVNRLAIFFLLRELLWTLGRWKNRRLDEFISNYAPDVIFAPMYDSRYTCALAQYVKNCTGKRVATFIADDIYTYKQVSISPIYWVNRFFLRRKLRKVVSSFDDVYVISSKQLCEYSQIFQKKCKLLYKGGSFACFAHRKESLNAPIRLIYAGNITSGRWQTLAKIGQALHSINEDSVKAQLYIYTQNSISERMRKALDIKDNVFLMGGIPFSEVKNILLDADIVVHVESFALKSKLETRLSFSTKLVDYFESGRCIFAVGWNEASSIDYLVQNDAAVVATSNQDIESKLRELLDNPQLILDYGNKAWECGKRNHQIDKIKRDFWADLKALGDK